MLRRRVKHHNQSIKSINDLAQDLSLPFLTEQEIDGIHCLQSKPGRVPPILVRFVSRRTKANWQAKRKELQKMKPQRRFYDNLTPHTKHLLWLTRTRATEKGYSFAWQKDGKVLVRKCRRELKFRITSEAYLCKIVMKMRWRTDVTLLPTAQQKQS